MQIRWDRQKTSGFSLAGREKAQYQRGMVVLVASVFKAHGLPVWGRQWGFLRLRMASGGRAGLSGHTQLPGSKTPPVLAGRVAMAVAVAE
jgi:hypothetical protein